MTEQRSLYGLVLAGGKSSRMGQDKARLKQQGMSQLEYAFGLLQDVTERQFVSTRKDQAEDELRARFPQIVDRFDDAGPVAGILSALDEFPDADWLVVACDLPNIDTETLRNLVANAPLEEPFTAYRSSFDGLPEPLCAIYRAPSAAIVRGFVDAGMLCPRKIMLRSNACLLDLDRPSALDNINTRDDLARSKLEAAQ